MTSDSSSLGKDFRARFAYYLRPNLMHTSWTLRRSRIRRRTRPGRFRRAAAKVDCLAGGEPGVAELKAEVAGHRELGEQTVAEGRRRGQLDHDSADAVRKLRDKILGGFRIFLELGEPEAVFSQCAKAIPSDQPRPIESSERQMGTNSTGG